MKIFLCFFSLFFFTSNLAYADNCNEATTLYLAAVKDKDKETIEHLKPVIQNCSTASQNQVDPFGFVNGILNSDITKQAVQESGNQSKACNDLLSKILESQNPEITEKLQLQWDKACLN